MTDTHPVWDEQDLARPGARCSRGWPPTAAARAAKVPTAREQRYLAAVEILYGDGAKARRDTLYSAAMERLAAANPSDDEAKLFYALSLLGLSQGVRNVPTYLRAAAIAESVFTRNRRHPGAAHYWIHGMDDPDHAAAALPAARALARHRPRRGPRAAHDVAHLRRAGNVGRRRGGERERHAGCQRSHGRRGAWGRASAATTTSSSITACSSRAASARRGDSCRSAVTQAASQRAGSGDLDPDSYSFITMWSRYVLDVGRWTGDVAEWPVDPGPAPAPRLSVWFTRGFAASRRGDLDAARHALAAYEEAARDLAGVMDSAAGGQSPDDREFLARTEVLRLELAGLVADLAGDGAAALDTLRRATVVEDGMAYAFDLLFVNEPAHQLARRAAAGGGPPGRRRARSPKTALARTPGGTTAPARHRPRRAGRRRFGRGVASAEGRLAAIWHGADADLPGLT